MHTVVLCVTLHEEMLQSGWFMLRCIRHDLRNRLHLSACIKAHACMYSGPMILLYYSGCISGFSNSAASLGIPDRSP